MEEKQVNKWLRHRFSKVGWALLIYYGLMNIMVAATLAAEAIRQFLLGMASGEAWYGPDPAALMNNAVGYILAIFVGLMILWAWKGTDYWRDEIFHREGPMKGTTFFALLTLMGGAQLISSLWIGTLETIMNQFDKSILEILESVSGDSASVSMFLYSALFAPISEEILFRGFALRSLRPYGKRFAVLGSAFLFAMFHGNLLQAPYAFLAGLVLGYAAVEYSIWWAAVLHVVNNLVLADLLSRLLGLLPVAMADILSGLIFVGFAIAAVVILVVKRREIKAYRQGEWMDRRCVTCFFSSFGVLIFTVFMTVSMFTLLAV